MPLNIITCTNEGANTGFGECFLDIQGLVKAFIAPINKTYTPTDMLTSASFLAKLNADILESKDDRIYPIGDFVNFTENSSEPTAETFGATGGIRIVREGKTDITLQFVNGGLCLSKALRKFNGKKYGIFFADSSGKVLGTKSGVNLKPIPLEMIYTAPFKFNTGAAGTVYSIRLVFDPIYLNDAPGWVEMPIIDVLGLNGLQDVALSKITATLPIIKVKASVGCAGTDLFEIYASELNSTSAFVLKNTTTGNVVTITSVATESNTKSWVVTADSADPDYTATAGGMIISFSGPSVLAGLGVVGFESNSITT